MFESVLFEQWMKVAKKYKSNNKTHEQFMYTLDNHKFLEENDNNKNDKNGKIDLVQPAQIRPVCLAYNLIEASCKLLKHSFNSGNFEDLSDYYINVFESDNYGSKCDEETTWYHMIIKLSKNFSDECDYYKDTTFITKIQIMQ